MESITKQKGMLWLLAVVAIMVFVAQSATAHFVCGSVNSSDKEVTPAWFSVKLYYSGEEKKYTTCDVSPNEYKFCCDADAIPPKGTWKIGKSVSAKIFDTGLGYVSDEVSLTTTGEGYDVLPVSNLQRVISLNEELEKIILSNQIQVSLNLSFKEPYTKAELETLQNKVLLCANCSAYASKINVSKGMNSLAIYASNDQNTFKREVNFALLESADFEKDFQCDGCSGKRIKEETSLNVSLKLRPSHEIVGMQLYEYVPVDWEISSAPNATITQYSQSHNLIIWNVSGTSITKTYTVKTPSISLLPVAYQFKTELENLELGQEEKLVYRIIPFFPKRLSNNFFRLGNRSTGTVTPKKPLVLDNGDLLIAIYPKKRIRNAKLNLGNISTTELTGVLRAYEIQTNLNTGDIDRILIESKENKTFLQKNNYTAIKLAVFNQSWNFHEINFSYEDEDYRHYKAFIPPARGIAVIATKDTNQNVPHVDDVLNNFFLPTVNPSWFEKPGKVQAIMRYLFFYYLR